jgi:predicted ABC-type ATPase
MVSGAFQARGQDDLPPRPPRASGAPLRQPDELARELAIGPYEAAEAAKSLREALVEQRESFVFETVFSDPVGDKLEFLRAANALGYAVVLCYTWLDSPELSDERVAMRVMQGGHDVPKEKLVSRYPRTIENLRRAIRELPHVVVFDNTDLATTGRRLRGRKSRRAERTASTMAALELNRARRRGTPWRRRCDQRRRGVPG